MYNAVPSSPSGARASSCLCAPFRAFRFARPCLGRQPGCISPDTAPGAVENGSTRPFSAGLTAHHEQQEEKRSNYSPVLRLGAPAGAQRSGSGGERTPARRRAFRSATAAKRRRLARRWHSGASVFSPLGGNKRCATCADAAGRRRNETTRAGSSCLLSIRRVKYPPPRPCS